MFPFLKRKVLVNPITIIGVNFANSSCAEGTGNIELYAGVALYAAESREKCNTGI